ncbi:MAG: pilus assembly protein TadG-related protein [Planctomycetota bacterium]
MKRKGAVAPLFALLLPVMILLSGFAINLAYMQLIRTELRVATDASARAAGVAFSELQSVDQSLTHARATAALNTVAGSPLLVDTTDDMGDISFGTSTKAATGSRYQFSPLTTASVRSETALASAVRVTGRRDVGSSSGPVDLFMSAFFPQFTPVISSVATQLDRDIALILDRSGSMAFHEDFTNDSASWDGLFQWVDDMLDYYVDNGGYWSYRRTRRGGYWYYTWTDPEMQSAYYDLYDYSNELDDYY